MKEKRERKTDYGNWVSVTFMRALYCISALLIVLFAISVNYLGYGILTVAAGLLMLAGVVLTIHMHICRRIFSFEGGGLMGKIHQHLIDNLDWNGQGKLLDIGCGAGALTVRCALKYTQAELTGIDYWGAGWNYAKSQCERNADIEGVGTRTKFQKGDASKLDFENETFDAVVSNFVFHEVRTQPDKRQLIFEALRVLKPGGAFALQDLFGNKSLYGDIDDLIAQMKRDGISKVKYTDELNDKDFIPLIMKLPWMMKSSGVIYGRK